MNRNHPKTWGKLSGINAFNKGRKGQHLKEATGLQDQMGDKTEGCDPGPAVRGRKSNESIAVVGTAQELDIIASNESARGMSDEINFVFPEPPVFSQTKDDSGEFFSHAVEPSHAIGKGLPIHRENQNIKTVPEEPSSNNRQRSFCRPKSGDEYHRRFGNIYSV
jgi:hypothetical protein